MRAKFGDDTDSPVGTLVLLPRAETAEDRMLHEPRYDRLGRILEKNDDMYGVEIAGENGTENFKGSTLIEAPSGLAFEPLNVGVRTLPPF